MSGSPVYIDGRLIGACLVSIGAFEGTDRGNHADRGDEGRDRDAACARARARRGSSCRSPAKASPPRSPPPMPGWLRLQPGPPTSDDRHSCRRGCAARRDDAADLDAAAHGRLRARDRRLRGRRIPRPASRRSSPAPPPRSRTPDRSLARRRCGRRVAHRRRSRNGRNRNRDPHRRRPRTPSVIPSTTWAPPSSR